MIEKDRRFLGTFFDRDSVIRWSRVIAVLAWIVAAVYIADLILSVTILVLQIARGFMAGLGPTDLMMNFLYIIERPLHGILYFALLQALSKGMLIALDMEENTRRAARS
jgi:hypothetical protein